MKVCFFGAYDTRRCIRNKVLLKGLIKNDVDVVECNIPSYVLGWNSSNMREVIEKTILSYIKLYRKHRKIEYDAIIVAFPGHHLMPLTKVISKKPIIFDAFMSLYDTLIHDRRIIDSNSVKAAALHTLDIKACTMSDLILLDTEQHIEYFHKEFKLNKEKFKRVFVGADEDYYYPRKNEKKSDFFKVMFVGNFIPLQGIETIIKSAALLREENILFELIGSGQEYDYMRMLADELKLDNVKFHPNWIEYEVLPNYIADTDICLGIFGNTGKSQRVIPQKIFNALAMEKPVITGDTSAARSIFSNGENCILSKNAEPASLAEAILLLKEDNVLRSKIAKNGFQLFTNKFSTQKIGQELRKDIKSIIDS